MKSYCLIRFDSEIDPNVSFTLGMIATEPIKHAIKSNGVIVTPFKSYISLAKCREMLLKYGHNFILIDVTENSNSIQAHGSDEFINKFLCMQKPVAVLTDDEREREIMYKIRVSGVQSLTQEEHNFMKLRF